MNSNDWTEVKKDWVYQRKKTLIFKSWSPRYMVLYSRPCPAIALYEQRSDSVPPYAPLLHIELTPALRVERYSKGQEGGPDDVSLAASRCPDDAAPPQMSPQKRGSITSLVSDARLLRSKKHAEENALVLLRPATDHHSAVKLVVALTSSEERDEWIARMRELVATLTPPVDSDAASIAPTDHPEPRFSASGPARPDEPSAPGLVCLGVTIIKDAKLARLQANQPTQLANSASDSDSLLNAIVASVDQKCRLVDNVFPEEYIAKYYQNLRVAKSSESKNDRIRSHLHLYRILAAFHDTVFKYVRIIIDDYHRKVPVSAATLYEFGPIRISLLPGYNQNDDTIIEYTNAVNRQELHAIRWINQTAAAGTNTMIVTCVEYKGFRFSAYLDVPLGAHTVVLDLCPGSGRAVLAKEEHLEELNGVGRVLNLALNNHVRLSDGRTVSLALPPSVELHHLPRNVAGYPRGPYMLNLSQIPPSWPVNPDNVLLCGLYRFRPEFLRVYAATLSAADFSPEKSLTAFKHLTEEHLGAVMERLEALEEIPVDSREWTELLHGEGVNCVLLGRLAQRARLPHIKEQLVVEMIGRTAKRALQAQLRGSILHFKEVQALRVEDELRAIVLHTMATIVGTAPPDMMNYVAELLDAVRFKFDYRVDLDTFRRLSRPALFLAIQHHSGLQFVDRVYDFARESPFAKEDFLMFVPTMDKGPICGASSASCYRDLHCLRQAGEARPSPLSSPQLPSEIEAALTETEALYQLGQEVLPLGEAAWQYPTKRAAIARQFVLLSAIHAQCKRPADAAKYLELARSTAPRIHAVRAFIELETMEQRVAALRTSSPNAVNREVAELKRCYTRAISEIDSHLGTHHPLVICVHQRAAELFVSLASPQNQLPLSESLFAHQNALAAATKALGRVHKWTRAQVLKIGEVNKSLGHLDEALHFYHDALKSAQQCGAPSVVLGSIALSVAGCQQDKGNLDEALAAAKLARTLLESGPNSPVGVPADGTSGGRNNDNPHRIGALSGSHEETSETSSSSPTWQGREQAEILDRCHLTIAELAQKIYEDVREDATAVLSDDIQDHLTLAVECYERLFDAIRQKPEIDGTRLLAVLRKIIALKLRLARPTQKILINAIRGRRTGAASQNFVSECIMRIVASPSATIFMDRNLERLDKPALAAAIGSGLNSSGEAKEIFDEFSCLLQICES